MYSYEFMIDELAATYIDREIYLFRGMIFTPDTDYTTIPKDLLNDLDNGLYYLGECEDDDIRWGKFSLTRKMVQQALNGTPKPKPKKKIGKAWKNDPATEAQIKFVRALGYKGKTPKTKGEAGGIISKLKRKQ
jgi:hypothetical protein